MLPTKSQINTNKLVINDDYIKKTQNQQAIRIKIRSPTKP